MHVCEIEKIYIIVYLKDLKCIFVRLRGENTNYCVSKSFGMHIC